MTYINEKLVEIFSKHPNLFVDEKGHCEVPEGIVVIAPFALEGVKALKTISFPSTLESIGVGAFDDTNLTTLVLPKSIKKVGINLGISIKECVVPDSVKIVSVTYNSRRGECIEKIKEAIDSREAGKMVCLGIGISFEEKTNENKHEEKEIPHNELKIF